MRSHTVATAVNTSAVQNRTKKNEENKMRLTQSAPNMRAGTSTIIAPRRKLSPP